MSHFGYNPKDASQAIPAGTYDASIKAVIETDKDNQPLKSRKSGEAMQKVVFEVYAGDRARQVSQYFTAKSMLWMYKKMAVAMGKGDDFKAGTFNAKDHLGAGLRLELGVEDSDEYGEQNTIDAFHPLAPGQTARPVSGPASFVGAGGGPMSDEDIPFAPMPAMFT